MDFDERESAFRLHQILCSLANEHRRYPVLFPPCEVPWSLDTWDARVRRLYAKCTHDTAPTLYHHVLRHRVDSEIANVVARVSVLLRTAKQITVTREVALTMAFLRAYDADRDHHFRRHHPDVRYLCAAYTEPWYGPPTLPSEPMGHSPPGGRSVGRGHQCSHSHEHRT
jgi:hypothetical protein